MALLTISTESALREAGNYVLTANVFHGLAADFCFCACILQVTGHFKLTRHVSEESWSASAEFGGKQSHEIGHGSVAHDKSIPFANRYLYNSHLLLRLPTEQRYLAMSWIQPTNASQQSISRKVTYPWINHCQQTKQNVNTSNTLQVEFEILRAGKYHTEKFAVTPDVHEYGLKLWMVERQSSKVCSNTLYMSRIWKFAWWKDHVVRFAVTPCNDNL